jgi:hypothetical protein
VHTTIRRGYVTFDDGRLVEADAVAAAATAVRNAAGGDAG